MSIDKEADKSGGGKPKPKPSSPPPPPRVDPKLIGNEHKRVPSRPEESRGSGKKKREK